MYKIAHVFVNLPIKSIAQAYTYVIPSEFQEISMGWRVIVPFGNRKIEGFVVEIAETDTIENLKSIIGLVDEVPWFYSEIIETARWIAEYYLCSLGEAMRLFMPGKSGLKITNMYYANDTTCFFENIDKQTLSLYQYIVENQPVTIGKMKKNVCLNNTEELLRKLIQKKFIYKESLLKKRAKKKFEKIISLSAEVLSDACLVELKNKPAQLHLVNFLKQNGSQTITALKNNTISSNIIKILADKKIINIKYQQEFRDTYHSYREIKEKFVLNDEQSKAVEAIEESIKEKKAQTYLLYGITGSGKTQVYIEAVKKVRQQNRKAIVLVPEIALTSQIIKRFKAYFNDDIIVMHSKLSMNERNDAISRLRDGYAGIVIGARSALFVPIQNVGIIIMDEEHDSSYKQDESPRYHTRDVARKMSEIYQAVLILGSATPSVETYYLAKNNVYKTLALRKRIDNVQLPSVEIVDMRNELRCGRRNILSKLLQELVLSTLMNRKQMIILLNRRGFSTFVMCRECGHVVSCANCTLPLVYHKNGKLQCHFCDTIARVPDVCPACGSRYIKYFGTGTERLEFEMKKMFPTAKIGRMDRDTMTGKMSHSQLLDDFSQGKYDILLGTQMVAKGHDMKNVTGVGIISADSGLNLPDFRAAERCFALLTQAAGRAGRGILPGNVVIQTYNPEHYAIITARKQDYDLFYQQEIELRKQLEYPPYSQLIKLTILSKEESGAMQKAEVLSTLLREKTRNVNDKILGPFIAAVPKIRELYRVNILLKTTCDDALKEILRSCNLHLRSDVIIDVNPLNVV